MFVAGRRVRVRWSHTCVLCSCACVCLFVIGMFCVHWNVLHTGQSSRDIELIFYTEIGLEPFDLLS